MGDFAALIKVVEQACTAVVVARRELNASRPGGRGYAGAKLSFVQALSRRTAATSGLQAFLHRELLEDVSEIERREQSRDRAGATARAPRRILRTHNRAG